MNTRTDAEGEQSYCERQN